jgi:hypothetical protein
MRARHAFKVSSTAPEATRSISFVDLDAVVELGVFVELGAFVGLDTAVPPPDVDVPLPDDSIMLSLAQPLTMSPNKMIPNAFVNRSMMIPPREKKELFRPILLPSREKNKAQIFRSRRRRRFTPTGLADVLSPAGSFGKKVSDHQDKDHERKEQENDIPAGP